jgi:hypothetical protein
MAVTPGLTNSVWGMTKFLLETVYTTLAPDEFELEQAELERMQNEKNVMSEFDESTTGKRLHGRRTSIVDLLIDEQHKQKHDISIRRESLSDYHQMMSTDADAFEQTLKQQLNQDSIYHYYYVGEDRKVSLP